MAVQQRLSGRIVAAVIVTYNPSPERFAKVLQSTAIDCAFTIIVDNGSAPGVVYAMEQMLGPDQKLFCLGENRGIAAAQNIGLDLIKSMGADRVLLLDQDSVPSAGMVHALASHLDSLLLAGIKVAAVGPRLVDGRWNSRDRLEPRGRSSISTSLLEVDHLIASGALIPLSTINAVGKMRSELFIDFVDIEWGLRALRAGYRSYVAVNTQLDHQLGTPVKVLGRTISTHTPTRHYYMVRNSIWLLRQSWLAPRWRFLKMPKVAVHLLINAVFAKPHRAHRKMMAQGLRDGFLGRMGKRDE